MSFKDKGVSTPRRLGKTEVTVEKAKGATVVHERHWDGRVDARVTPPPVNLKARVHRTGKKRGQVAEVRRKDE